MRVWTRQSAKVLEILRKDGVFRMGKRYAQRKYDDCSGMFMICYDWLAVEASKRMKPSFDVEGPIWLALRPDFLPCPEEGTIVLEMEIPEDSVMTFDIGKWDYILNFWYIPLDDEDRLEFRNELDAKGIRNQSEIVMTEFHPILKRRVMESWERLFDEDIRISENDQAICWEIRSEWVVTSI